MEIIWVCLLVVVSSQLSLQDKALHQLSPFFESNPVEFQNAEIRLPKRLPNWFSGYYVSKHS